jgi:hypothetical protein
MTFVANAYTFFLKEEPAEQSPHKSWPAGGYWHEHGRLDYRAYCLLSWLEELLPSTCGRLLIEHAVAATFPCMLSHHLALLMCMPLPAGAAQG